MMSKPPCKSLIIHDESHREQRRRLESLILIINIQIIFFVSLLNMFQLNKRGKRSPLDKNGNQKHSKLTKFLNVSLSFNISTK